MKAIELTAIKHRLLAQERLRSKVYEIFTEDVRFLIDLIEELEGKVERLQAEVRQLEYMDDLAEELYNRVWKAVILKYKPDYGDWDYPDMMVRHVETEVEELHQRIKELEDGRE